jgi:hypothetical protein
MDLGTILGVSVDVLISAVGATAHIASIVKCIHDIISRNHITVVIKDETKTIEISPNNADEAVIRMAVEPKG